MLRITGPDGIVLELLTTKEVVSALDHHMLEDERDTLAPNLRNVQRLCRSGYLRSWALNETEKRRRVMVEKSCIFDEEGTFIFRPPLRVLLTSNNKDETKTRRAEINRGEQVIRRALKRQGKLGTQIDRLSEGSVDHTELFLEWRRRKEEELIPKPVPGGLLRRGIPSK